MEYIARYKDMGKVVPHEKRKEINDKIVYMIDNNLVSQYRFTPEIIFNFFTGNGGLHGLDFKDFNSFYEFTQAKQEKELGAFFTNQEESKKLIDILQVNNDELVGELSCGSGALLNYLPNMNNVYCNELDIKAYKVCKYLFPEATITHGDMRDYNLTHKLDVIIGNPPFNLRMKYEGVDQYSQMIYIKKANELMNTSAIMGLIVPYSFLNDEFSNKSDIEYMNENFNFIGQFELNKGAFEHVGVDSNFRIKMMFFVKKSQYLQEKMYINEFTTEKKIKEDIAKIRQIKEKNRASIKLENMKNYTDEDQDFEKKVTKILFDIKRSKHVKHLYNECFNYYQLYYNQSQPSTLSNEEWSKIKITKEKVIKKLKDTLSSQHKRKTVKSENLEKTMRKKLREKNRQDIPFEEMKIDENIDKWLSEKSLYNEVENIETKLNNLQKYDLNKVLRKKYSILQWEMGSGKSYSSLYYGLYRMEENLCKNIFVVAPAIAIKNTYVDMLENFNLPYRILNNKEDIGKIKKGEFLLLTFNMVIKNQRWLKRFFRFNGKKFALILDEADSISNINSKRCKAVLNCFKTNVKYKVLLTGTSVRNSINEIYTQLELLYNNSLNMLCENEYIYAEDKEQKKIKKEVNEYYNKQYPPYKQGYELFTKSHIPKKVSTFGVAKFEQHVYNKDSLKKIIDKTIITRTLEDVIGKKLYNIHQVTCDFTESEKNLYNQILNDFYKMSAEYHIHTGNSRKDAMFKILAQLNTLLKSCSTPHKFKEYEGENISSKILKVCDMVKNFKSERVAIGCTRIKTVKVYAHILAEKFPNRKIFVITGQDTTLKQRKEMVEEMKKYNDCIILSTQQALSCSMNIGFVNKVIIPEMQWNESGCSQYKARFSRMNSEKITEIYNVFYKNSIEVNLLKLNMAKDKLCSLMKNEDLMDEEIYEKFNIDPIVLEGLMVKEETENGINITWGNQKIS